MSGVTTLRKSASILSGRASLESYRSRPGQADESFELDDEDDDSLHDQDNEPPISIQEKHRNWIRHSAISCIFILLWYIFSVTLSVYNKWMFSENGLNFNFPILTTSGHQLVQFLLSSGVLLIAGRFKRPQNYRPLEDLEAETGGLIQPNKNNEDPSEDSEILLMTPEYDGADQDTTAPPVIRDSRWEWFKMYLKSIVPCAIASAGDIGMGNVSFRFVTLTFYTMVKSSSLAWVLLFGILFKLEVPTRQLVGIIGVMTIGVVMMVAGEANFVLIGFLLVLGAAIFSGLRWSLTQLLLRSSENRGINTHNDPLRTIMYLSPVMGILLFLMGGIIEGYSRALHASLWTEKGVLLGLGILVWPGVLAFCMTLSEFMLLGRTSVLTLSIAGILKELVTIVSATVWFHDRMTLVNALGLAITLSAIIAYNFYRYRRI